ncbi:MAG: zinc ABC transporter substrate-binding protein [Candidatus Latescibacteria bacterium]|nr:zinc ABC transporter substrate-binding protein [Candidatus Latescibacterota bacterium]
MKLVTTTSLIGKIAQEVGKDKVDVVTIVPGGMCPGHFDVRPGDIKVLSDAQIFLIHGWEPFVKKLLNSVQPRELVVKTLDIQGNWMVPDIQVKAVDSITDILCEIDHKNGRYFRNNAATYKTQILDISREIKQKAKDKKVSDTNVVCSEMQEGFVRWFGFNVVATYGRPSELTAKNLRKVIDKARKEGVEIVVDNLQSGRDAGVPIIEEIRGVHVVLTNFPIGSYTQSLQENVYKLLKAIRTTHSRD